jgi:hypothetical protein
VLDRFLAYLDLAYRGCYLACLASLVRILACRGCHEALQVHTCGCGVVLDDVACMRCCDHVLEDMPCTPPCGYAQVVRGGYGCMVEHLSQH